MERGDPQPTAVALVSTEVHDGSCYAHC
jgi:hypothetical protein